METINFNPYWTEDKKKVMDEPLTDEDIAYLGKKRVEIENRWFNRPTEVETLPSTFAHLLVLETINRMDFYLDHDIDDTLYQEGDFKEEVTKTCTFKRGHIDIMIDLSYNVLCYGVINSISTNFGDTDELNCYVDSYTDISIDEQYTAIFLDGEEISINEVDADFITQAILKRVRKYNK